MPHLDRYILSQTLNAFLLFCLILAGVIWLTQAVRLIDIVLSSGQSLFLLVEFSLLVLPRVLSMVVPLAGFAAVIYTINKLYSEAELVVMMMSGQSPYAIARPILWFSIGLSLLTLAITNFLAPMGELRLENNRNEIRSELANALIREGRFLHPTDGLTVFIREASETGQMAGLFLHDERDPERPVTYTAEQALLLRDGPIARLIMSRGVALTFSAENALLARVQFDEFTYDLSDLVSTIDT
ncbi:MAG: LptF/LptG family permease, partial [Pseudomonadota bacterium]